MGPGGGGGGERRGHLAEISGSCLLRSSKMEATLSLRLLKMMTFPGNGAESPLGLVPAPFATASGSVSPPLGSKGTLKCCKTALSRACNLG